MKRGTIIKLEGSWSSGMAGLTIKDQETGELKTVYADSGPLGRALSACYGAARPGHIIDNAAIEGQEIYYSIDGLGLLEGFEPVEE